MCHQVAFGTPTPTAPRTKPFEFKLVPFKEYIDTTIISFRTLFVSQIEKL